MKKLILILGNQLFEPQLILKKIQSGDNVQIFMREDRELCTYYRHHKQKIQFFLTAMRKYAEELKDAGFDIHYESLGENSNSNYETALLEQIKKFGPEQLCTFEIEDQFFEKRISTLAQQLKISLEIWQSPMFLSSRDQFKTYLGTTRRPFMKNFYQQQRKRLRILVDENLEPIGGQWSFDEENRKPLPKNYQAPELPKLKLRENQSKLLNSHESNIAALIEREFADHPGSTSDAWLPNDRAGAVAWLDHFLKESFHDFGPYEDALSRKHPFLNHSILTPFLNTGLLTPELVIDRALKYARKHKIPMNSCEGFVRQVIGWREFIRGIYQNYGDKQSQSNFWKHDKKLTPHWYDGTTGIDPLDDVIRKTIRYGYAHHIERLMIVGCLMLLLEIQPAEAHRWFMEMFIDSSDWVMGPNVYGMALFSDGGIFATKPYICGSNYYRKMGGYTGGAWQDGVDGLYWGFIGKHRDFFLKNHRMSMAVRTFEKMDPEKLKRLNSAATVLRERLTR
jgi:deoxyribodipyrimidine photolyase-related protein